VEGVDSGDTPAGGIGFINILMFCGAGDGEVMPSLYREIQSQAQLRLFVENLAIRWKVRCPLIF
jgi:hypothetical protein